MQKSPASPDTEASQQGYPETLRWLAGELQHDRRVERYLLGAIIGWNVIGLVLYINAWSGTASFCFWLAIVVATMRLCGQPHFGEHD